MKSKNIKVIDEHNIDRDAVVMFAVELDGSEYVVYWISRDEESNNVFVSKVLKNIDGTYNMLNIDDSDKKKEVAEIIKALISSSVSDQNDKLVGTGVTLSNGKVAKIVNVLFNKEQHINVTKTYITTVKKEVTKVAEKYYDIFEEEKVDEILPAVAPVVESPTISVVAPVVEAPIVSEPAEVITVMPSIPLEEEKPSAELESVAVAEPITESVPVEPVVVAPEVLLEPQKVEPVSVLNEIPSMDNSLIVEEKKIEEVPTTIPVEEALPSIDNSGDILTAVNPEPISAPASVNLASSVINNEVAPILGNEESSQPLVFNGAKETNLNAALGEVASTATIPVENINSVREFGVESSEPIVSTPIVEPQQPATVPNDIAPKAGFANSKFFMVVAVAFFLASCIFLGYEVYNYFQLVK